MGIFAKRECHRQGCVCLLAPLEVLALNQSRILPTKGDIKKAPASAQATAWVKEKINVQLQEMPSDSNFLTACIPSQVPAIFIKIRLLGTPDFHMY